MVTEQSEASKKAGRVVLLFEELAHLNDYFETISKLLNDPESLTEMAKSGLFRAGAVGAVQNAVYRFYQARVELETMILPPAVSGVLEARRSRMKAVVD